MKQRFTVRRHLVVTQDGEAVQHDFVVVIDFEAITNKHFLKAVENKGKRRRMACGAMVIIHQTPPDFKAGVTDDEHPAKDIRASSGSDNGE